MVGLSLKYTYVVFIDKLTSVVQSFESKWKQAIESINSEIVKSFTDFKNGTNILQVCFPFSRFVFFSCYSLSFHYSCILMKTKTSLLILFIFDILSSKKEA